MGETKENDNTAGEIVTSNPPVALVLVSKQHARWCMPKVALADEAVRIGPPPALESYLEGDVILEAAKRTGAQVRAARDKRKEISGYSWDGPRTNGRRSVYKRANCLQQRKMER